MSQETMLRTLICFGVVWYNTITPTFFRVALHALGDYTFSSTRGIIISSISCSVLVCPQKYTHVSHLAKFWCGLIQINDQWYPHPSGLFHKALYQSNGFLVPKEYSSRLFPVAYWYVPRQTVRTLLHFEQPNVFPSTRGIFIESVSCGVLGFDSIKNVAFPVNETPLWR